MKRYNVKWSHCSYEVFDESISNIIRNVDNSEVEGMVFPKILSRCKIGTPCVMISKEILNDDCEWFNENMRQGQDYCFWNKLAKSNRLGYVRENLVIVRYHNTNIARNVFYQLKARCLMYDYLIENRDYFKCIPIILEMAFAMCKCGYWMCKRFENRSIRKGMSYLCYLIPYMIFRAYYKFA